MGQAPAHLGQGAPQTSVFQQQPNLFPGNPLNTVARPLFAAAPPASQHSWAPPPSLSFSVPPPGSLPPTGTLPPTATPIYPPSYNQQPLPPAYYPTGPQYVSYPAQYPAYTPTAPPIGAAPFNLPPPNVPTRERSPLRRERSRERDYKREEVIDQDRGRDKRSSTRHPREVAFEEGKK